jgi:hypothetical protein
MTRLDEYDKEEWFTILKKVRPGLTREEFEPLWEKFAAAKVIHQRQQRLH